MSDMNQLTWLLGFPLATLLWSWPRSNIARYLGQPLEKKRMSRKVTKTKASPQRATQYIY